MPGLPPQPPLVTSALGLGLDAFVAVRAAVGAGVADARAAFELTLDAPSRDWGFLVLAGVEPLVDALERLRPRPDELQWLEATGAIDGPTRRRLAEWRFACDVDSAPEGSIVFPGAAAATIEGPFWQAQLVEGLARAALTDATLVATRFARMAIASDGADLVEHGAATAHRLGGVPLLARAAYIGGARATTSALAGRRYRIPVTAAQPPRLELALGSDDRALRACLGAAGDTCVLRLEESRARFTLPRIVTAVRERVTALSFDASSLVIELPDGDRAGLARDIAEAFDAAGLDRPSILATGDVSEQLALELRACAPPVDAFALSAEAPSGSARLSRYDLVAIEDGGAWSPRLRAGQDIASSSDPGRKLLIRYLDASGHCVADVAHLGGERILRAAGGRFVESATGLGMRLSAATSAPLRAPVLRAGKRASPAERASVIRERAQQALADLDDRHKRTTSPARYPVGMTPHLATLKSDLLARLSEG